LSRNSCACVTQKWHFLNHTKKGLADGSFVIWKGPITDNTGKVQVAKDSAADDKFLGGLNFFVKGVEGKVPGAK